MFKGVQRRDMIELIGMCLALADYIDEEGHSGNDFTVKAFGRGYSTCTNTLRSGVKAVIDLMGSWVRMWENLEDAIQSRIKAQEFDDLFGDTQVIVEEFSECDKERLREIVRHWPTQGVING